MSITRIEVLTLEWDEHRERRPLTPEEIREAGNLIANVLRCRVLWNGCRMADPVELPRGKVLVLRGELQ
jgi:hypothetical protein